MRFLILLAALAAAAAQQFEVASVKPAPPPESPMALRAQEFAQQSMPPGMMPLKGTNVTLHGRTLKTLIAIAWRIRPSEIECPDWLGESLYDVEARLPEGAAAAQANDMLRALLEDRFALRTHQDTRTLPGFVLTVAKDGPKLKLAVPKPQVEDPEVMKARMQQMQEERMKKMQERMRTGTMFRASWSSNTATSAQLATAISNMIHAPVIDETGLAGKYDAAIEVPRGDPPEDSIEHGVALEVAKLGLKLESRKTTVTHLVVDSARKTPTEN
jgi:uncharacterized protein (TIGR03435 family)